MAINVNNETNEILKELTNEVKVMTQQLDNISKLINMLVTNTVDDYNDTDKDSNNSYYYDRQHSATKCPSTEDIRTTKKSNGWFI